MNKELEEKLSRDMENAFNNLTQKQKDDLVVALIKEYYNLYQKDISGSLSDSDKRIFDNVKPQFEKFLKSVSEQFLKEHNLYRPYGETPTDPVFIELSCPHCNVFAVYDVDRNRDSVIECISCRQKIGIKKDKFKEV